jgi:hypothetical protein
VVEATREPKPSAWPDVDKASEGHFPQQGHISSLLDPNWAFHMSKLKLLSRRITLVFKVLQLEAIYVSESAPKDHAILGCENISRAELISLVNLQVPRVLYVDASVLGLFGVLSTSCLDLLQAS